VNPGRAPTFARTSRFSRSLCCICTRHRPVFSRREARPRVLRAQNDLYQEIFRYVQKRSDARLFANTNRLVHYTGGTTLVHKNFLYRPLGLCLIINCTTELGAKTYRLGGTKSRIDLSIVYPCHLTPQIHMSKSILLTGGAGFIASHVVRLLARKYPYYKVKPQHPPFCRIIILKHTCRSPSSINLITVLV